ELVDSAKEAKVAFLNEIHQRHAAVAACKRHDDSQIRLHELRRHAFAAPSRALDFVEETPQPGVSRSLLRQLFELCREQADSARMQSKPTRRRARTRSLRKCLCR